MDDAGKALQAALTAPEGVQNYDAISAFDRWRESNPTGQAVDAAKLEVRHLDLSGTDWSNISLDGGCFDTCTLDRCTFAGQHGSLYNVVINNGSAEGITITDVDCRLLRVTSQSWDRARVTGVSLENAVFKLLSLRAVVFDKCRLAHFTIENCTADAQTQFTATTSARNFRVDQLFLDSMEAHGGLKSPELAEMTIADEIGSLRMRFGGAYAWVHAISLAIFVLPYLLFTAQRLIHAAFVPATATDPHLYEALLGFIVTAGEKWHDWTVADIDWVSLTAFAVVVIYNAGRLVLLMSVYRFERQEAVFRRRAYSLGAAQKGIWRFVQWGYWLSLASIAVNTVIFLAMRVPA